MHNWKKWSLAGVAGLALFACSLQANSYFTAAIDWLNSTAPGTPASGKTTTYVDSTNKLLSDINDAGTVHHTVQTIDCSSGSELIQKINADGSGTCASGGGGGGGFIQPLTAPVAARFSQVNFNVGSGVTTTEINNTSPVTSITLRQQDPNSTGNIVAVAKNILAATFTVTVALSMNGDMKGQPVAGLWISDGTANNIIYGNQAAGDIRTAAFFTTFGGSFSGFVIQNGASGFVPSGPLQWYRIQETASARNYYVSSDGITFELIFTESNTAHFTTSQYGWAAEYRGGAQTGDIAITCYSFTETNP